MITYNATYSNIINYSKKINHTTSFSAISNREKVALLSNHHADIPEPHYDINSSRRIRNDMQNILCNLLNCPLPMTLLIKSITYEEIKNQINELHQQINSLNKM